MSAANATPVPAATPAQVAAARAALTAEFPRLPAETLDRLAVHLIDPGTARAWTRPLRLRGTGVGRTPAITPRDLFHLPDLLAANLPRRTAATWYAIGVERADFMLDLHRRGAHPDTAMLHLRHTVKKGPDWTWSLLGFARAFRAAADCGAPPALCNAVLAYGGTAEDVPAWHARGVSAEQAALCTVAGIAPAEVADDPTLADADPDRLAALAALRGVPITLPIRVPGGGTRS